jgi:GNAT superfamily N-acetyltransferase
MFSPRVLIRPSIARDKADVLEFTKFIWEGHDYIAYVWDDWYMDPHGILAVAEYGGVAVGMGKVARVSKDQWWLEGLRVDPKYQGLKIGTQLHIYLQDWWEQHGGGTLRLMTSWERVEVHHLCERFGWTKVGEVKEHMAPSLDEETAAFAPVQPPELDEALRFALSHLDHSHGLADLGWQEGAVDAEILHDQCARGDLFWWQPGGAHPSGLGPSGLVGVWPDEEDGEPLLGIAFMACDVPSLAAMLLDVRRLAARGGIANVTWHAPARDDVEATLRLSGFISRWDGSAYIYEKK